jgi:hypothetical protein
MSNGAQRRGDIKGTAMIYKKWLSNIHALC